MNNPTRERLVAKAAEALLARWVQMVVRDHQEGDDRQLCILVDMDTVVWGDGGAVASEHFAEVVVDAIFEDLATWIRT